jgi:murein DD-endopeptidase MepM/ murein hydrolase activator NlpD
MEDEFHLHPRLGQRSVAVCLIVVAVILAVLGTRHTVSGESCAPGAGGRACNEDRVAIPDAHVIESNRTVAPGLVNVFAPTDPQSGLSTLQLTLISGSAGLSQAAQKQVVTGASSANLHWPASGPVTQAFGVPELGVGAPHTGVDIGQPAGSPVRAAQSGRVTFAGGDPCCSLGYWVEINHGDHYSTRYGHMMRPPIVLEGDYVTQGQILGFSGNTGFSTGPHVHFEVRFDGAPLDPLRIIPAR